jgi:hypothetical protein
LDRIWSGINLCFIGLVLSLLARLLLDHSPPKIANLVNDDFAFANKRAPLLLNDFSRLGNQRLH